MENKDGKWKGFVNIRVVLQMTYQQGRLKVQAITLSISSRWLTIIVRFASASSLLLKREDLLPVLQGQSMVSQSLPQEHGYRNTGGMGKLEGAEELAYGTYPAQPRMLLW
jgi:hypothetical protein